MFTHKTLLLAGVAGIAGVVIAGNFTGKSPKTETEHCLIFNAPVIALDYGSRYEDDSKNRADLDEDANDAVNAALAPVDDFIRDLAKAADKTFLAGNEANHKQEAICVVQAIKNWASADALSELGSTTAQMTSPSRVGGIATIYNRVSQLAQSSIEDASATLGWSARLGGNILAFFDNSSVTLDWMSRRGDEIVSYFDNEAPTKASRNNLSAWAAFAVGEIGIATGEQRFKDWSLDRISTMIDAANPDGSLPLEMGRGSFSLHYQLHASSALIVSMANLCADGHVFSNADMEGIERIADFSIAAVNAPQNVEQINGHEQNFSEISSKNSHAIAWVEAFVALTGEELLDIDIADLRPLSNSKLGGNMTDFYQGKSLDCRFKPSV